MTTPATPPAGAPAPAASREAAHSGLEALASEVNAEIASVQQATRETLANPNRTAADLAAIAARQEAVDRKAAQLETYKRSLTAKPVEVPALVTPDADAVVEPLDLKEFPPLSPLEIQATGYAKGLEKQELDARENLHRAHAQLARYTARLAELKAAMGTGISPVDQRFEAFMESRGQSHSLTFDEIERLNGIRAIRQANHEYQQLRERVGNLKARLPFVMSEVRRVRGEAAKEAEREAARKKLRDLDDRRAGPTFQKP